MHTNSNANEGVEVVTRRRASATSNGVIAAATGRLRTPANVQIIIDGYGRQGGKDLTQQELDWVKRTATAFAPQNVSSAKMALRVLSAFARYVRVKPVNLDDAILDVLTESQIKAFRKALAKNKVPGVQVKANSADTYRSRLMGIRKAMLPSDFALMSRSDIDEATVPYDSADRRAVRRLMVRVDAGRAHPCATVLGALSLGGGLTGIAIDTLRTDEWTFRQTEVHVPVHHPWERTVVIRGNEAADLIRIFHGKPGCRPLDPEGTGITADRVLHNLLRHHSRLQERYRASGQAGSAPAFLNLTRARTTWIVERLTACPRLDNLLHEAGIVSAAALDRYLQYLPNSTAPRKRGSR